MSPAKVATPPAVAGERETAQSRFAAWVLTAVVIVATVAISGIAGYISFYSIRELALFFEWPPELAWLLMPLIELFILAGTAEHAHRIIEGEKGRGPLTMAYAALLVTLACNVGQHTLMLIDARPGVETWRVLVLGIFGAFAPLGQMGGLHMLMTRLARVAAMFQKIKPQQGPSAGSLIKDAVARRVVAAIDQPGPAPASSPGPSRARTSGRAPTKTAGKGRRRKGPGPVALMRAYWEAERAEGREPSLADMDRAAGVEYQLAKNYRQKWLDQERGVPNLADRRVADQ